MIRGVVSDRRAMINLTFRLPGQPDFAIEFDVDTAFRGALAMPPDAVNALRLPFVMEVQTLPASGIPFQANLHRAVIVWQEQPFSVPVLAMGIRPLLGTGLLQDHGLYIEYIEGGEVRIESRT